MSSKQNINRRKLLENASATMLLLPLMRMFRETEALGQDVSKPNVIFFYYGGGSHAADYWPTGGAGGIESFGAVTKPLAAHKDSLTFIRGLSTRGASNHYGGPKQVLAGHDGSSGPLYSLDQQLADSFAKRSIALGVQTTNAGTIESIIHDKKGTPLNAQDNPKAAFEDFFGGFTATANFAGSSGLALADLEIKGGKKRMLDFVRSDMNRIKGKLGAIEGQIFEKHVSALDQLIVAIAAAEPKPMMPAPGPAGSLPTPAPAPVPTPGSDPAPGIARCNPKSLSVPPGSGANWYHKPELTPAINTFNRKMMVEAIACGLSRVGVMQYGFSDCGNSFNFEGLPQTTVGYHGTTHERGPENLAMQGGIMTQIATVISDLKAIKVGSGSLFDQTLVIAVSDIGDRPNEHNGVAIPCFIAGTLGGKIKGNRIISYPYDSYATGSGVDYNHFLVSIAQVMGLNVQTVGNKSSVGPLKELLG